MNPGTFAGVGPGVLPANGFPRQVVISSSTTWVAPYTGRYLIACIGPGGGGAIYGNNSGSPPGAGAGGIAWKTAWLGAGAQLTITIGAGGTNGNPGNAGGTTYVYGPGLNLVANGGAGAVRGNVSCTGSAGGNASGGDVNYTGGTGGNANTQGATGGGAVAFFGIAYNGGTVGANLTASGGGGIGGNGGSTSNTNEVGGGGGALFGGRGGTYGAEPQLFMFNPATNAVAAALPLASMLGVSGFGFGGAGFVSNTSNGSGNYGVMGGSGGVVVLSNNLTANAPKAYMGGGGGGIVYSSGVNLNHGAGGDGCVMISWVQT